MNLKLRLLAVMFSLSAIVHAQAPRGALVREGLIYLSPDTSSAKVGRIDRGREVIILESSRNWLHVEANISEEKTVTGWMLDKGIVRASTPDGDKVLYGEAVDSE